MPGGFAPRFAIEAGFLILLGVGAGLADLRATVIVAVLAGAWVIVSLIEFVAWQAQTRPLSAEPVRPASAEPELEVGWPEEAVEPNPPAEDDSAYPLRPDAGDSPSEEVEAYTRVLGGSGADGPSGDRSE